MDKVVVQDAYDSIGRLYTTCHSVLYNIVTLLVNVLKGVVQSVLVTMQTMYTCAYSNTTVLPRYFSASELVDQYIT